MGMDFSTDKTEKWIYPFSETIGKSLNIWWIVYGWLYFECSTYIDQRITRVIQWKLSNS